MTLNELLGDLEMHPNDEGKLIVDLELEKFNILVGKLHELNNNWNELKKWLESKGTSTKEENDALCYFYTYKKMQELQGDDKN